MRGGGITGTLSDQTDLQTALNLKANTSDPVSTFTNDAGYITSISAFSTTDLSEGTNLYYTEARVTANAAVTANTAKVSNVTTNLTTTQTATTVDVVSSDGTDATLPQVIASGNAGVMSGVDKAKLDGIATGAEVNIYSFNRLIGTGTQSVTSTLTAVTWNASNASSGSDVTFSGGNPTRLTAVSTGAYKVAGYLAIQSAELRAQAAAEILINGTATGFQRSGAYIRNTSPAYDYWTLEISSTPFSLTAGDYVELGVGQVTGATYGYSGALTINCDRSVSEFWLERVA